MTEDELAAIRLRVAKSNPDYHFADTRQTILDRRALLQELDRVRALWDDCRAHCFDPNEVKPPFRSLDGRILEGQDQGLADPLLEPETSAGPGLG